MGIVADFEEELLRHSPPRFGRWMKVDLHNHSPASHDYRGDRSNWILEASKQIRDTDLQISMFTDHGVLPDLNLSQELESRTGRTILRGVELNIFVDAWDKPSGKVDASLFFHLLIGFDPQSEQSPDWWLGNIYKECKQETVDSGGTKIVGVRAPIEKVCEVLATSGAIVIPAHLHSGRDAFKSRSIDKIYSDPIFLRLAKENFTALEVTNTKTAEFFDGNHGETGNLLKTCIQSSDAHEASNLGTRASWVQMEVPTFAELKAGLELPFRTTTDVAIRQLYLDTIAGRESIRTLELEARASAKTIEQLNQQAASRYSQFRTHNTQVLRLEESRKGLQELTDGNLIALRNRYEAAVKHRDALQELPKILDRSLALWEEERRIQPD